TGPRDAMWLFGFVVLLLVFCLAQCSPGDRQAADRSFVPASAPRPTTNAITYLVQGGGSGAMTYSTPDGGTEQVTARLPWSHSFRAPVGTTLYLSAQNQESSGDITASILLDGTVWRRSNSSGGYTIATASGNTQEE